MNEWCECRIEVKKLSLQIMEDLLSNYQFCSYSVYQKKYSRKAQIRAFVPFSKRKKFLQDLYSASVLIPLISKDKAIPEIRVSFKKSDDYSDEWKRYFKPLKIGRFVIKPTWEEWKAKKSESVIEIDPGMAFGTGQHFTTCYCIKQLQKYCRNCCCFLDAGCGSGILSIAAARLKVKNITGIVISRSAVSIAKDNFKKNCPKKKADFKALRLEKFSSPIAFDCIAANLTDTVIIKNADILKRLLKKRGILILTGIRHSKMKNVLSRFSEYQLLNKSIDHKKEWSGITLKK